MLDRYSIDLEAELGSINKRAKPKAVSKRLTAISRAFYLTFSIDNDKSFETMSVYGNKVLGATVLNSLAKDHSKKNMEFWINVMAELLNDKDVFSAAMIRLSLDTFNNKKETRDYLTNISPNHQAVLHSFVADKQLKMIRYYDGKETIIPFHELFSLTIGMSRDMEKKDNKETTGMEKIRMFDGVVKARTINSRLGEESQFENDIIQRLTTYRDKHAKPRRFSGKVSEVDQRKVVLTNKILSLLTAQDKTYTEKFYELGNLIAAHRTTIGHTNILNTILGIDPGIIKIAREILPTLEQLSLAEKIIEQNTKDLTKKFRKTCEEAKVVQTKVTHMLSAEVDANNLQSHWSAIAGELKQLKKYSVSMDAQFKSFLEIRQNLKDHEKKAFDIKLGSVQELYTQLKVQIESQKAMFQQIEIYQDAIIHLTTIDKSPFAKTSDLKNQIKRIEEALVFLHQAQESLYKASIPNIQQLSQVYEDKIPIYEQKLSKHKAEYIKRTTYQAAQPKKEESPQHLWLGKQRSHPMTEPEPVTAKQPTLTHTHLPENRSMRKDNIDQTPIENPMIASKFSHAKEETSPIKKVRGQGFKESKLTARVKFFESLTTGTTESPNKTKPSLRHPEKLSKKR